jgi:prepilin-type N-terminal cleavage/methylation domain-containing protein/prepilin-type processing-associated H-X9-DG protein
MKTTPQLHSGKCTGFTLLELLTAIAVLALLAVLGIVAYQGVMDRARDAQCITNLRQIGVGIAGYASEHNNRLPGPLLPSQGPRYNKVDGEIAAYLASFIAPYIGIPEAPSGPLPALPDAKRRAPMFFCPAFGVATKNQFPNSYFMRWKIQEMGTSRPPWGNYGTSTVQVPMNLMAISNTTSPSSTWAVCCLDQLCPDLPVQSWVPQVPATPVHGNNRNALFFDWHVGKISAAGEPL